LELDGRPVRFDIQRTGNLVAFSRFEKVPVFNFSHEQRPSFGINFKKYVTSREKGGDLTEGAFQQVFTCSFGHFKLIINSKVDCAIEKETSTIKLSDGKYNFFLNKVYHVQLQLEYQMYFKKMQNFMSQKHSYA
jgi:hypothetical protein